MLALSPSSLPCFFPAFLISFASRLCIPQCSADAWVFPFTCFHHYFFVFGLFHLSWPPFFSFYCRTSSTFFYGDWWCFSDFFHIFYSFCWWLRFHNVDSLCILLYEICKYDMRGFSVMLTCTWMLGVALFCEKGLHCMLTNFVNTVPWQIWFSANFSLHVCAAKEREFLSETHSALQCCNKLRAV